MTRTRTTKKQYEVLRIYTHNGGWLTIRTVIDGSAYYVQAKVFDVPSEYGIGARDNDGNWICDPENMPQSARISKMAISHSLDNWSTHGLYNYDRGLDYDNTPAGMLDTTIGYVLESVDE